MKKKPDTIHPSDEELIASYHQGDNTALATLIARYAGWADRKVRANEALGSDAEDAKQELLVALVRAVSGFQPAEGVQFRTYVNRCMDHAMTNFLLHLRTKKSAVLTDAVPIEDLDERFLCDFSVNPEETVILQERFHSIETLVAQMLSSFEQKVLFCYLADDSYEEIANQLNCSVKAVDNALQRIRRKLKTALRDNREPHPFGDVST